MQQLTADYGEDNLVTVYYHLSDAYEIAEGRARATSYAVSGIPETDFDAVSEVVGAGTSVINTYRPIVVTRMGTPTPITMTTTGVVSPNPSTSWVTTTFRVAEAVPPEYGTLRAQFVVYERLSDSYPWTVRDMLPVESISTLSAIGDSAVVTRNFVVDPTWNANELHVVVFLEDPSPWVVVNAQLMPDPFDNRFAYTDFRAREIPGLGEAVYHTVLENTGVMADTITLDIAHEILPDGLGPYDWVGFYCDTSGACHFGPWDYVLAPAEKETFDVHVLDSVGTVQGMALTALTATSKGDPTSISTEQFATFVDVPSILVVDDDAGATYETYLETALGDTGYTARVWDANVKGRPDLTELASYWTVLWTTANADGSGIDVDDENNMMAYLDGGGNLMLASMGYLSSRIDTSAFITDYLHVDSWTSDNGGFVMTGVASDPISDGMSLLLLGGPFAPNASDGLTISAPADVAFTSPPGNKGLTVAEDDHKIVFMSFPFEDVKVAEAAPNNQKTLIARILGWFDLPSGVEDAEIHRLALRQNFPNPFNPVTKVAFTVPEGAGRVTLTVHNVNGQVVRTLVDEELPAGPALAVWNGTDDSGRSLASGVYFARLVSNEQSAFRKMTLLK
ncbi:MAG: FlgD immunoglobulin-like domain containing protein [Candidatus Eisenbacteria bacterium]